MRCSSTRPEELGERAWRLGSENSPVPLPSHQGTCTKRHWPGHHCCTPELLCNRWRCCTAMINHLMPRRRGRPSSRLRRAKLPASLELFQHQLAARALVELRTCPLAARRAPPWLAVSPPAGIDCPATSVRPPSSPRILPPSPQHLAHSPGPASETGATSIRHMYEEGRKQGVRLSEQQPRVPLW